MSFDVNNISTDLSVELEEGITITPISAPVVRRREKKNISWTESMEIELVKAILKNKAHIKTEVDKNIKWERVLGLLKTLPVFSVALSQHEV